MNTMETVPAILELDGGKSKYLLCGKTEGYPLTPRGEFYCDQDWALIEEPKDGSGMSCERKIFNNRYYLYRAMKGRGGCGAFFKIKSPTGEIHSGSNLEKFAKDNAYLWNGKGYRAAASMLRKLNPETKTALSNWNGWSWVK